MGELSPSSTATAQFFSRCRAFALALAFAATIFAQASRGAWAAEELVDGIAAQVGSQIVLVSDVLEMTAPMEAEINSSGGTAADVRRLRTEGLERMIEWRLIEQIVRQAELYAGDEEIDRAIEAIGRENGLTPERLKESVVAAGIPYSEYRAQLKREIERSKVVGMMVSSKVEIAESEVEALYRERYADQPEGGDQIHLRQLLILYGGDTGRTQAEACAAAEAARARVMAGVPFQEVAREDNAIEAARGGDIGWVHSSALAGWMTKIADELQPGELSEIVTLPFGCSLLEVVERRAHQFVTFERAQPRLVQELSGIKEAELYQQWMEQLRRSTFIERRGRFANAAQHAPGGGTRQGPAVP